MYAPPTTSSTIYPPLDPETGGDVRRRPTSSTIYPPLDPDTGGDSRHAEIVEVEDAGPTCGSIFCQGFRPEERWRQLLSMAFEEWPERKSVTSQPLPTQEAAYPRLLGRSQESWAQEGAADKRPWAPERSPRPAPEAWEAEERHAAYSRRAAETQPRTQQVNHGFYSVENHLNIHSYGGASFDQEPHWSTTGARVPPLELGRLPQANSGVRFQQPPATGHTVTTASSRTEEHEDELAGAVPTAATMAIATYTSLDRRQPEQSSPERIWTEVSSARRRQSTAQASPTAGERLLHERVTETVTETTVTVTEDYVAEPPWAEAARRIEAQGRERSCSGGGNCLGLGRKTGTAPRQGAVGEGPPRPGLRHMAAHVPPPPPPPTLEVRLSPPSSPSASPRTVPVQQREPSRKRQPSKPNTTAIACEGCGWTCRCPNCRQERKALPALLVMGPSPDDLPDEIRDSLSDLENGNLTETEVERLLVRFAELVSWGSCIDVLSKEASLRAIIKMMRRWPLNETIQVSGCQILGSIAARGEEQRRLICRLGGVAAVAEALKKHPRAVAVQEKGCWALRQLSVDGQCRREVMVQRGIDAVVQAMREHPDALAVLENACMALANLAVEPEIRTCVTQAGGVEAIVRAMVSHLGSPVLQESACFALHNVACTNDYQQLIAECDGIEAAVKAMRAHPDHAGVQESGCSVFHNVANGPPECLEAVNRSSVVEAVIEAMQGHPAHAGVQEKASHALGQVGDVRRRVIELEDRRLRDKIVALGGAEALRKATKNFRRDAAAKREAEEALSVLELAS